MPSALAIVLPALALAPHGGPVPAPPPVPADPFAGHDGSFFISSCDA